MTHQSQKRAAGTVLTVTKIEAMRPKARRYEITDVVARGLQLRVERSGRKVWLHRYTWNEKSIRLTLGPYPRLSLIDARAKVNKNQEWLEDGIDPRRAEPTRGRRARPAASSGELAEPLPALPVPTDAGSSGARAEILPPNWPTDRASSRLLQVLTPLPESKHSVEFMTYEFFLLFIVVARKNCSEAARVLVKDVLPHWKGRDARTIKPREVIELLDGIVKRNARVMANRTAAILRQLFLHGVHRSTIESSPVQLLFQPGGTEYSSDRALSDEEISSFFVHRFEACNTEWLARVLTILLLTAVRRRELAFAKWEHINFEKRIWFVPAENTKSNRAFLVPLTRLVSQEFRALQRMAGGSIYVLPRKKTVAPIHPAQITQATARSQSRFQLIGIAPFTPHDLRRSCRTGLMRIRACRRFIARQVLNHKQPGVDGIYDLHDYLKEKRRALRRWSNHAVRLRACTVRSQTPIASNATPSQLPVNSRQIAGHWVKHFVTREELHHLVWSTPMRILCREFAISNVWLAKICARHEIRVPGRGYWAKQRAGAVIPIPQLRPASQGIPDCFEIRGGRSARLRKPSDSQASPEAHLVEGKVEGQVPEPPADPQGNKLSVQCVASGVQQVRPS
jgi:integrase